MTSDRSSGRVEGTTPESAGHRLETSALAGGRLAAAKRRPSSIHVTPARVAAIAESLTPVDWSVLESVGRFGMLSGPQLTLVHFGEGDPAARAARRCLARLTEAQVLHRLERRIGGVKSGSSGIVYRVGLAGLRLLADPRRTLDEPGLHHVLHTLAVGDVFVRLKVAERQQLAKLHDFQPEPECWRRYIGPHGEPEVLKPDAFCDVTLLGSRRLWFVEVDRGTVSTTTLKKKLARYAEYLATGAEQAERRGTFPRVVWLAPEGRRTDHLTDLARHENERLGGELHRLMSAEWQPPPEGPNDEAINNNQGGEP